MSVEKAMSARLFESIPSQPPRGNIAPGIKSIGIELECELSEDAWHRICASNNPRIDVQDDCSIVTTEQEITAEVLFWSTSMKEMEQFLRVMYDDLGVSTNDTMGFHVHIKPARGRTWLFETRTYWDGFYQAYRALARKEGSKYRARMQNVYCRMVPWEETAYGMTKDNDRYVAINLQSLEDHSFGTVEHRILPHQDSRREAMRSLRWLMRTSSRLMVKAQKTDYPSGRVGNSLYTPAHL